MDTMFENLDFRFDKENNDERPFMIACKDREIMDGERWVVLWTLWAFSFIETVPCYGSPSC